MIGRESFEIISIMENVKIEQLCAEIQELKSEIWSIKDIVAQISHTVCGGEWKESLDPFVAMDYSLRRNIEKILWDNSQNIHLALRWAETLKSAEFVKENLPVNKHFDPAALRYDSLARADQGLYLEFGVAYGHWINLMAAYRSDVVFHGFDSFEGLPEGWSLWPKGHYDNSGNLPPVRENVQLIKGYFSDTLDDFLLKHGSEKVAFVHLDCDLYDSSKYVLEKLRPHLKVGTQIVLDDYLTQPGWEKDQFKAFNEFVLEHNIEFTFTGYTRIPPCTGVSVEITGMPNP